MQVGRGGLRGESGLQWSVSTAERLGEKTKLWHGQMTNFYPFFTLGERLFQMPKMFPLFPFVLAGSPTASFPAVLLTISLPFLPSLGLHFYLDDEVPSFQHIRIRSQLKELSDPR
jgi:hypothetical protein